MIRRKTIGRMLAVTGAALALTGLGAGGAAAAAPAWRVLAATEPTHLPPRQSEVQRITVEAEGGTFALSRVTGEAQGSLSYGKGTTLGYAEGATSVTFLTVTAGTAFTVGQPIIAGPGIPPGTTVTSVSADGKAIGLSTPTSTASSVAVVEAGSKEVTGLTSLTGEFHAGDPITGTGVPAGTTVSSVSGTALVLSSYPTLSGAETLSAIETTDQIDYDAPPADVQGALEALPAYPPGAVTVTGGPGGDEAHPYLVEFGGSPYADQDVTQFSAVGSFPEPRDQVVVTTAVPGGPGRGSLTVSVTNVGAAPSSAAPMLTVSIGPLPAGIETRPVSQVDFTTNGEWSCPAAAAGTVLTCTYSVAVPANASAPTFRVPLVVGASAAASTTLPVTVSAGGAAGRNTYDASLVVSSTPAAPGVAAFWAGAFDADGNPVTQAGAHPYTASAAFWLNTILAPDGVRVIPAGQLRVAGVGLPPGFVGNPLTTQKRCPQEALDRGEGATYLSPLCTEAASAVGGLYPGLGETASFGGTFSGVGDGGARLFNDLPASGTAAQFTANVIKLGHVSLFGSVRSDGDFGVDVGALGIPTAVPIYATLTTLEGFPASALGKAFLRNPTDCSLQQQEAAAGRGPFATLGTNSWANPNPRAIEDEASATQPAVLNCRPLTEAWVGNGPEPAQERATFSFQPSADQASSGTAATARLHIPQRGLSDPSRLGSSDLKKTVVTLPPGLTLNPSAANGLSSCSEEQMGYKGSGFAMPNPIRFDEAAVTCPESSRIGTVDVASPLLEEELHGTIYLAAQDENPFHSLVALYLVVESKRFGITLKLPGEVKPDPSTGRLTATFDDNPQLPFEDLTLHFRGGGPRSQLATPDLCGSYKTTGALTPWSAESESPAEAAQIEEDGFQITSGPGGGACARNAANLPFSPSFEAGTTSTQAGAYAPLVIKLARKDGEQELTRLEFTLPPGLTGKLAGIPYCSEGAIAAAKGKSGKAEQASPSCPAASVLGTVDTAAGVGPEPIHVGGHVYLAGPYEGAPLSSVVITPAVAGPFDLGNVVVRAPLFVNPETAQITARSDEIPHILRGIPLKLRSVEIKVDRAGFTLNPTSCDPMSVTSGLSGLNGGSASPQSRFQVGGCAALLFKPKLKIRLKGATRRTGHPALKAVVTYPKHGTYANIRRAQVNLPHGEFLDQGNLNRTCTRPVLMAGNCPKSTVYGRAKAWTPLLDRPLEGFVYLVGGYGYKLPALVADLNGQIRVTLVGKVDSGRNKGIRNTFEVVPDAPVSRFVLEMKGGKRYGLLENSENLCKAKKARRRAIVRFTGQNGKVRHFKPVVGNQCRGHGKHRKMRGHARPGRRGPRG